MYTIYEKYCQVLQNNSQDKGDYPNSDNVLMKDKEVF